MCTVLLEKPLFCLPNVRYICIEGQIQQTIWKTAFKIFFIQITIDGLHVGSLA